MQFTKKGKNLVMGIRGKWRHPEYSNGLRPPREWRGMNLEFVDNKCDVCASGVCVTITRPREEGAWVLDFFPARGGRAHIALVFPWEDEYKKSQQPSQLVRRHVSSWREVCGYINAVKEGIFTLKTWR